MISVPLVGLDKNIDFKIASFEWSQYWPISHKPILKMNESYEQALISESKYKLLDQRSPILAN